MSDDAKKWIRREEGKVVVFVPKHKLLLSMEEGMEIGPVYGPHLTALERLKLYWKQLQDNSETPE